MEAARAAAQARKTRIDELNVDKDYRKMNAETGSKVVANIFDEIEQDKSDSSEVTCLKVAKTEAIPVVIFFLIFFFAFFGFSIFSTLFSGVCCTLSFLFLSI